MFEKAKGMKICKTIATIFFGALGFLFIDEQVYLVSQCHVKKNCSEIFHIFLQQIFFNYFFMICFCFLN